MELSKHCKSCITPLSQPRTVYQHTCVKGSMEKGKYMGWGFDTVGVYELKQVISSL